MMLHETGPRAQRDRATVIASYRDMVRFFRVPRRDRLTTNQIAKMTSKQIYQACRDLYNGVSVKQARKYGIKRGFIAKPNKKSVILRLRNFMRKVAHHG